MSAVIARRLPGTATLADLLALPDDGRPLELIDGELVEKEAASGGHGRAQGRIARFLGPFDRRPGGRAPGGWIFATDVLVAFDDSNTVRPDVAGWHLERLPDVPDDVPLRVRPDWTCEILSTNRRNDLVRKKRLSHQHQVPHYWIVDPIEQTLSVYRWSTDGYVEVLTAERGERVRAEPFDSIELSVGFFFGEDEEE